MINQILSISLFSMILVSTLTTALASATSWSAHLDQHPDTLKISIGNGIVCSTASYSIIFRGDLSKVAYSDNFHHPLSSSGSPHIISQDELIKRTEVHHITLPNINRHECIINNDATVSFYSFDGKIFRIEVGYVDCTTRNQYRPYCFRDMIGSSTFDRTIYTEFQHKAAARGTFSHSMVFSPFQSDTRVAGLASALSCNPQWGSSATSGHSWRCLMYASLTNDVWHGIGIHQNFQRGWLFDKILRNAAGYQEFVLASLHKRVIDHMHEELRKVTAPHREAAEAEEERKRLLQRQADELLSRTR